MYCRSLLLVIAWLLINPKSIKLLSAGCSTILRRAKQNTCAEITPLSNKYFTNEGYPSLIAAGFAVKPIFPDIAQSAPQLSPEV